MKTNVVLPLFLAAMAIGPMQTQTMSFFRQFTTPATVQYAGGAPGQVAGLMHVNVQIPSGVQPGGYVPVVLQVGDRSSSPAVWIAVAN